MAYKYKFGNCRIPNSMPEYKKLATVRTAYNNIQSGKKPGNFKLTTDRMERLEDIGFDFEWSPAPPKKGTRMFGSFDHQILTCSKTGMVL